jgi:hypothetical protein
MAPFDRSSGRGTVIRAAVTSAAVIRAAVTRNVGAGGRGAAELGSGFRLEEFEARYRELLAAQQGAIENERCVQCEHCRGCSSSTFCRHSQQLVRCHYCVECEQCTDCSHCQASQGLLSCHHCVDTRSSMGCTYLVRCSAMAQCNYCMGCVGLSNRDYHILNQPYDRSTYFELSQQLLRQLRL